MPKDSHFLRAVRRACSVLRHRSGAALYAWALSKGYKHAAAITMLQDRRGSSVTILDDDRSGPRHFKPQIELIYGITRDTTAELQELDTLKDGCVVLPEWTEVAGTSVA